MKVYLVQHGEAEPKSVAPTRPLTERGRQEVQRVATFAGRLGLEVHQIRHSGKTRAEQTAAILGETLSPPGGVVAVSGLAPLDDVRPVADALAREQQPAMLVGHLPFLTRLTGLLVTGDPDHPVVQFRNGGIVSLAHEEEKDAWLVAWILTPEMANV
ncbi:MAG: phosphohistidine phosphatase SixA [Chloroflexota bacterium]|nr:phosphohistidine phosphatase SixA [Chloroflexota bacterium]